MVEPGDSDKSYPMGITNVAMRVMGRTN